MGVNHSKGAREDTRQKKMASIKLTYFDLRARAEPCRLLLAYAGTKYEDDRLPAPWDNMAPWAALKPSTPWGQLPLLSWNGEGIAQSMACSRFLAREFNLAGRTSMEMAQVDEIIDVIQDLLNACTPCSTLRTVRGSRSSWRQTSPPAWRSWRRSWRAGEGSTWSGICSPGRTFTSFST